MWACLHIDYHLAPQSPRYYSAKCLSEAPCRIPNQHHPSDGSWRRISTSVSPRYSNALAGNQSCDVSDQGKGDSSVTKISLLPNIITHPYSSPLTPPNHFHFRSANGPKWNQRGTNTSSRTRLLHGFEIVGHVY